MLLATDLVVLAKPRPSHPHPVPPPAPLQPTPDRSLVSAVALHLTIFRATSSFPASFPQFRKFVAAERRLRKLGLLQVPNEYFAPKQPSRPPLVQDGEIPSPPGRLKL